MYNNVSQDFKNRIAEPGRRFRARLVSGADVIEDIRSFDYNFAINGEDNVGIGGGVSAYINVVINNTSIMLSNREFDLELGLMLDDESYEYVTLGKFTPKQPKIGRDTTSFTAYDRMQSRLSAGYFSEIESFPADAKVLLGEVESMTGITVNYQDLPDGVMIDFRNTSAGPEKPFTGYTYGEALYYIAQLYGKIAYVDRFGEVQFEWFTESEMQFEQSQHKDIVSGESAFVLGCIKCTVGDNVYIAGGGTTGISIENPVMTEQQLIAVYNSIGGFSCTESSVPIIGNPCLDICDIVKIAIAPEEYLDLPIMKIVHKYDGGFSTTIYSWGKVNELEDKKGPVAKRIDRVYSELLLVRDITAQKVNADELYAKCVELGFASINALTVEVAQMGLMTVDQADLRYMTATQAEIEYATVANLTAVTGRVSSLEANAITTANLSAKVAELGYASVSDLQASVARISTLEANSVTIDNMETLFARIDMANISKATIGSVLADVGLITEAVIVDGHVTGSLDSVSVNANNITAGILSVDRLVIRGSESSLVYELNNISGALQSQNVNTLNGEILTDRSITCDKIVANSITANELNVASLASNEAFINNLVGNAAFINNIFAQDIVVSGRIVVPNLKMVGGMIELNDLYPDYTAVALTSIDDKMLVVAPTYIGMVEYLRDNTTISAQILSQYKSRGWTITSPNAKSEYWNADNVYQYMAYKSDNGDVMFNIMHTVSNIGAEITLNKRYEDGIIRSAVEITAKDIIKIYVKGKIVSTDTITASGDIKSDSDVKAGNVSLKALASAGYITSAGSCAYATSAGSAGSATTANKVWTQSHPNDWYINSNWNGTYFVTNASNGSTTLPIKVNNAGYADSAGYATSAGNADTVDSLHIHTGRNNEANKLVRTNANGYILCGYINCSSGNEKNNSNPTYVWGTNGSDDYMRTYKTSALSVSYATTAGSAPASDVSPWAKASSKPSYAASEISCSKVSGQTTVDGCINALNSNLAKKPVEVNVSKSVTTSTTMSDTGVSVTIPANSFVCITARAQFNNTYPLQIGISPNTTITSILSENVVNTGVNTRLSTTLTFYTTQQTTYRVFARYQSSGVNSITLWGFYIPT